MKTLRRMPTLVEEEPLAEPATAATGPSLRQPRGNAAAQERMRRGPAALRRATGGAGSEIPYRSEMEQRFGQDLSGVRSHTGAAEALTEL